MQLRLLFRLPALWFILVFSKGKMVNSLKLAAKLISRLPADQAPETTEGYEGFIHPNKVEGTVASTTVRILIRDHDKAKFEAKKELLKSW